LSSSNRGHARGGTTRVPGPTGEDCRGGRRRVRGGTARRRCWWARGAGAPAAANILSIFDAEGGPSIDHVT
jgi:hypothetical protein